MAEPARPRSGARLGQDGLGGLPAFGATTVVPETAKVQRRLMGGGGASAGLLQLGSRALRASLGPSWLDRAWFALIAMSSQRSRRRWR
jgi:hypothetical protein